VTKSKTSSKKSCSFEAFCDLYDTFTSHRKIGILIRFTYC